MSGRAFMGEKGPAAKRLCVCKVQYSLLCVCSLSFGFTTRRSHTKMRSSHCVSIFVIGRRASASGLVAMKGQHACHGDECAHCLAVLRDDVNDDNFVKVADVGAQRMLYFSGDDKCSASMPLPAEWQTSAVMEGSSIAQSYFPPTADYLALFMIALCLLPMDVLASSQRADAAAVVEGTAIRAPRLLILGGGGGTLAVLYSRLLPSAVIDVVEPSIAVLTLGQRFFGLSCEGGTIRCHRTHARAFLEQHVGTKYDLIALDAFENDGEESSTPRAWSRREWCDELSHALIADHGVLVANLYAADESTQPFRDRCDSLRSSGSRAVLQTGRRGRRWNDAEPPAQTVEAWSSSVNIRASGLRQAAAALRRHNAVLAAELSRRAGIAWRGQVLLGRDANRNGARGGGSSQLDPLRFGPNGGMPSTGAQIVGVFFALSITFAILVAPLLRPSQQRKVMSLLACIVAFAFMFRTSLRAFAMS